MSSKIIKRFDVETLGKVVNFQSRETIEGNKRDLSKQLAYDIECAAIKHLVLNLKKDHLEQAVNYLNIDHGNNNPSNKMVLSKRLKESMEHFGIGQWIHNCDNQSILKNFAKTLSIKGYSSMGIRVLGDSIVKELDIIGAQIVFGNLNLQLLKECCETAKIKNYTYASTKTPLIQALTCNIPINVPEKTRKVRARKPKFAAIEDCETYDQLFQYYKVDDLVAWCKDNSVKTSGNKKVLINRILAFLAGDKENTMSDPSRLNRKKSSSKAKKPTKEYPEPSRVSSRLKNKIEEEEEEDDAMDMSENTNEEVSQSDDMELSAEEDPDHPTSLEGLTIALYGTLSRNKEDLEDLIRRNNGTVHTGKKLKKDVTVVCPDVKNSKYAKVAKMGIRVVEEDFFDNLE